MSPLSSVNPPVDLVAFEEGFRNMVYLCPAGYPTVGFGRRVRILDYETNEEISLPTSRSHESFALATKLGSVHGWLSGKYPWFDSLSPQRQAVLISLTYQVGREGFTKFRRMISALSKFDFEVAALQYLDSDAARQCPGRFARGARVLANDTPISLIISPLE